MDKTFREGKEEGKEPSLADKAKLIQKALEAAAAVVAEQNNPNQLLDIDVTYRDLVNPKGNDCLNVVLHALRTLWVGEHEDREHNVRIGAMRVVIDDDGCLCMRFTTRFALSEAHREVLRQFLGEVRGSFPIAPEASDAAAASLEPGWPGSNARHKRDRESLTNRPVQGEMENIHENNN